MECIICGKEFNPGFLHEVVEHEHLDKTVLMSVREGICVSKSYSQSPNIAKISYNDENSTLDVTYINEDRYRYRDVSREKFEEAIGSKSIGAFLNRNIKGKYTYHRVT